MILERKRHTLIIEISGGFIKAVVRQTAGGRVIEKIIIKNLPRPDDTAVTLALGQILKESNLRHPYPVVVISRSILTVRNLKFPSADLKEIESMVELYAPRQVPFAKEEMIYDFQITGKDAAGYSNILLAIAQRDVIRRQLSILEQCGISAEEVVLSSEGFFSLPLATAKIPRLKGNETSILINIDNADADFVIISRDNLLFTRSIGLGVEKADAEKEQARFLREIKHSLVNYQNEDIARKPARIFICGLLFKFPGLAGPLSAELNIPVEIIEQLENLPLRPNARQELKGYGAAASVYDLLGIAIMPPKKRISLLPRELKMKNALKAKFRHLLFIGVMLVTIFVLISSLLAVNIYAKERYLKMLEERLKNISKEASFLQEKQARSRLVLQQEAARGGFVEAFGRLIKAVPPQMTLVSISYGKNDKLIIKGQAEAMSYVLDLAAKLEEAGEFSGVKTNYTTKRKIKDKEITDFEIFSPLESGAVKKEDKPKKDAGKTIKK